MAASDEILSELNKWAPSLGESLLTLAYLGSSPSVGWYEKSPFPSELHSLIKANGQAAAAEMWRKVLKEYVTLPAPVLLLVLEHMRRSPADVKASLDPIKLGFSRSLANVAHRAAGELYEDARNSFASHEIDVAIARFRKALSEFRFSIESQLLSEPTRRIATGKYATAVAMIGRWVGVSPEVVSRALAYSKESMGLGNLQAETLTYRIELLVLQFDQTGEVQLLQDALALLTKNPAILKGTELAEAEVRFRLGLLSKSGTVNYRRNLEVAKDKLTRSVPKGSVEEARCSILLTLADEAVNGQLAVPANSLAIPKGLLSLMATKPSSELWRVARCIVDGLEALRKSRESVPSAALSAQFLRVMVDGPDDLIEPIDLSRYVEITGWLSEHASYNRHAKWEAGAAALSTAKRTGNQNLATLAHGVFSSLSVAYPNWPLPRIGIARVEDFLADRNDRGEASSSESWRDAAQLALSAPNYARSKLGGRNEVFIVADARGFLSEAFVFKRTTRRNAEHEAAMLDSLRKAIAERGDANRFTVPRSLAIVEVSSDDERKWVHVSQRSAGRLVSELSADEASHVLESVSDLLAVFHRAAGSPPPEKSAWRPIKGHLKMWSRTLFDPLQADSFVDSLRASFPGDLPLARKRDGHASNWIVDPAGRIVAIDFESTEFVPIGYDIAQLIEDNALVPATSAGWRRRLSLVERYLNRMEITLLESELVAAYGWFALTRALRLGTEREAGKQLRRHARELCSMLIEHGNDATQRLARELSQALSRIEHADARESAPSHDHRRLSKAMAYLLRHHGPQKGVPVDKEGFAAMEDLAVALGADASQLLAVVEHPGEPRFEIRDGRIRALYGHSLDVVVDVIVNVGSPSSLFHGSSWPALDSIIQNGLIPMGRRMVHLTNVADEAMAVGERKGTPIIFAIAQGLDEEPVAEGIWVAASVPSNRLSIVNPYVNEAGASR